VVILAGEIVARSSPADAAGAYASENSSGNGGWAKNYANDEGAKGAALNNCEKTLASINANSYSHLDEVHCKVVSTFHNKCFALAKSRAGDWWSARSTQAEAEDAVLQNCRSSASSCKIHISFCDGDVEAAASSGPATARAAISAPAPALSQRRPMSQSDACFERCHVINAECTKLIIADFKRGRDLTNSIISSDGQPNDQFERERFDELNEDRRAGLKVCTESNDQCIRKCN
jgi:hypothetical protein